MFTQTWKKYLPVIFILLKRSGKENQTLNLNHTDFERAAGGRKMKFSFSNLRLVNGRLNSDEKHTAIAKELALLLQEDLLTREFIRNQHVEFAMNKDFELSIKNNTPVAEIIPETVSEENLTHAETNATL